MFKEGPIFTIFHPTDEPIEIKTQLNENNQLEFLDCSFMKAERVSEDAWNIQLKYTEKSFALNYFDLKSLAQLLEIWRILEPRYKQVMWEFLASTKLPSQGE